MEFCYSRYLQQVVDELDVIPTGRIDLGGQSSSQRELVRKVIE